MEIEMRECEGDEARFLISDTNPAFVNSLRRAIIQEIPVMAIDEIDFVSNDSVMDDEMLAHRLGQIPLRFPEGYRLPKECDCADGRCPKCSAKLSLKMRGPCSVQSGDLEPSDQEVVPVDDLILITRLGEGEKLEFTAVARLGFGKEHADWQPALAAYQYMPIFNLDEEVCEGHGDCVDACSVNILELEDDKVRILDVEKCILCKACVEACPEDAIKIDHDSSKIIFKVESFGGMSPEDLFERAAEVMRDKNEEFAKKADKIY